jgi:predicted PurR-regulated permease PerM
VPQPAPETAVAPLTEQRVRALIREELASAGRTPPAPAAENSGVFSFASRGIAALNFVLELVGGIASFVVFSVICAFCFYYFSVSFPAVKEFGGGFIPDARRERTLELVSAMDRTISAFVRGRLTICFIMGMLYAIGWTLCGVPHAILLGLLVGACSLVPYLSAIGLPAAWALLAVSLTAGPAKTGVYFTPAGEIAWLWVLLLPGLVTALVQIVEDYILNPVIQGKATNLHPVTIMLAVIAGGSLAGVYGMLLAIPFTACLKIYISEILMPRVKQWLAGKRKDPIPV